MTRTERLAKTFGGKIMLYKDLPIPAQLAIAHYMAIDGEAWALPELVTHVWSTRKIKSHLPKMLPYFRAKYGKTKFGYVHIPMEALIDSIVNDENFVAIEQSEDDFRARLGKSSVGFRIPNHPTTNRWPIILSSNDYETIQDGWHRLGAYYKQVLAPVPAVYYHE